MKLSTLRNVNGDLVTLEQACQICNLGKTSVRKLAQECDAGVKIGRNYRINKSRFLQHIIDNYTEKTANGGLD